ncbi:malectin domain-containing carbohydrate-binding protein, partial [Candidatus Latescibacterota bacterium]
MRRIVPLICLGVLMGILTSGCGLFRKKPPIIVYATDASFCELLAAREVRRYVYLRTGEMLEMMQENPDIPDDRNLIVVATKNRPLVQLIARYSGFSTLLPILDPGHCVLRTVQDLEHRTLVITAGDDVGTLYGAYRFAEHLGVRFSLSGDIIPTEKITFELPEMNEDHRPLFETRGILPFHGYPEGPDWWSLDDYKAVLTQLSKLGMNFIGLHASLGGESGPEPSVWVGLADDLNADGTVTESYHSHWFNTLLDRSGYQPTDTGDYHFGASLLFDRDQYGPQVMDGLMPEPENPQEQNELFNRTGDFLGEVFSYAERLGIKTCTGTEVTLRVPPHLEEQLRGEGANPPSNDTVRQLFEGMFEHLMRTLNPDYCWLWTPESWLREEVARGNLQNTIEEYLTAVEVQNAVGAPFTLAACGWMPGSPTDPGLLNALLPREMPLGALNGFGGMAPVDNIFELFDQRPSWVIPWLEDDADLTMPQLWVGRLRADAAAARGYRTEGLIGLHWRTRVLDPNIIAFAQAAWHQERFQPAPPEPGPVGDNLEDYASRLSRPARPVLTTAQDSLYLTFREDIDAYLLEVPIGTYTVTLKFCEPTIESMGQRIFSVELEGNPVISDLDIFAFAGNRTPLDFTYRNIMVADGVLDIRFIRRKGTPVISAIVAESGTIVKKINCGGPVFQDYEADEGRVRPRDFMTDDFYRDWALHQFGDGAAEEIAAIFEAVDGKLPRPSEWRNGPGSLFPDHRSWDEVSREYAFVSSLERLRTQVTGDGNRERFDYWLNTFTFMQVAAQLNCFWGEFEEAMEAVNAETVEAQREALARATALPIYRRMVAMTGEMYRYLLATVSSSGELGTVTNIETHSMPHLLGETGDALARVLGSDLPPDVAPSREYEGEARLIVPTVRTVIGSGEP